MREALAGNLIKSAKLLKFVRKTSEAVKIPKLVLLNDGNHH